jgi:hypothetical protein
MLPQISPKKITPADAMKACFFFYPKHQAITPDAVYWQKCYIMLLTLADLFGYGSFSSVALT